MPIGIGKPYPSQEAELKDTKRALQIISVAFVLSLMAILTFFSLWQDAERTARSLRETNARLSQDNEIFRSGPVCHSITEDSIIWDCDYRRGGWYRR